MPQFYAPITLPANPTNALEAAPKQYVDGLKLTITDVKAVNYPAGANEIVLFDTTAAARTLTLPTAPANGTQVGARIVTFGAGNYVTVTCGGTDVFDKPGGPASSVNALLYNNQSLICVYYTGVWARMAGFLPMASTDARYTQLTSSGGQAPYTICTSSTRPASPVAGQLIFETDTYKTLQYTTATTGWQKPWSEPWGLLVAPVNNAGSVASISSLTDIVALGAITTVANRYVRVTARFANLTSTVANDTFNFAIQQDAGNIANIRSAPAFATANGEVIVAISQPSAASHIWKLTCTRSTGTGTGTVVDSTIFIEDIGPSANPA